MRKLLLLLCFTILCNTCFPQFYPFDSIPGNLRKNANAVVRSAQCLFTVIAPGKAVEKVKMTITLLNENADSYRHLTVFYDNFRKVNYIRGRIFDEKGMIVKAMGASDIFDMSAISGEAFYSDKRKKIMRFPLYKYPYTIEYEYQVEHSSLLGYPEWKFQEAKNVSIEKSGIQFVFSKEIKFRYSEQFTKNKVDSVILPDKKIYTWQEENIPARSILRSWDLYSGASPVLEVAPSEFEYAGYKGSMQSWKSFGEWVYSINKGRDKLPDDEIAEIRKITSGYPDTKSKVKAVYEYMQSRTRYVLITIGAGGYQTAEASSVSLTGFGDCKALVNYTSSLLRSVGIESYMALVKSGPDERDINTGFVNVQFDHVILCVPEKTDTIWLECTSQDLPFNYLGSFTSNRHALLITPDGGKLVKTQQYRKEQNIIQRTGSLFFNVSGKSSAKLNIKYSGYYFGDYSSIFALQSEDEMTKTLYSSLEYPDFTVTSTKYSENKSAFPTAEFRYEVDIRGFGTTNGKQLFFNPSITKEDYMPEDTVALRISVPDITIDSVSYWLPQGYGIESLPADFSIRNKYGSYMYKLKNEGDKLVFYRRFELENGIIPASEYNSFREFYNTVANTDRSIVILKRL
ncbi:MAG TPA: DUF3857 and transglutaminase domain-containing protein [Bacteroidales bacterium]|nr:DUF3857 and transglutaminase domain-containing protein [Bacteroidales bacterium]